MSVLVSLHLPASVAFVSLIPISLCASEVPPTHPPGQAKEPNRASE